MNFLHLMHEKIFLPRNLFILLGLKTEKMGCCFPVQVSNFKFLTLKTNSALVSFT